MRHVAFAEPGRLITGESPEPVPGPGEALVRVHRVGICGTDLHAFAGRQPFFEYPRIPGHELGVEVLALGQGADRLQVGDRCAVEPYLNCGHCIACHRGKPNCCESLRVLGVHTDGGLRPRITVAAAKLHPSARLSFDQLALVETLGIGAHAIERATLMPADRVLVIGAGPIGLAVIQFALANRANLTVMDVNPDRLGFVERELGVSRVLLPDAETTGRLRGMLDGALPDVVIDATGNGRSMEATFELATHGGRIVFVGLFSGNVTFNDPNFHRRELTLLSSRNSTPETFGAIIAAIEAGTIDTTTWITHRLKLAEVPDRFAALAADPTLLKGIVEVG